MRILVVAEADKREKIEEHWKWITENLLPTVGKRFSMISHLIRTKICRRNARE